MEVNIYMNTNIHFWMRLKLYIKNAYSCQVSLTGYSFSNLHISNSLTEYI